MARKSKQATSSSTALVPITDETATVALQDVYRGLPGDVVFHVESERIAIGRDIVDHLRAIRDALAPYGRFKEWCEAVGLRYGTVTQRLSRADSPYKQPVLQSITASPVLIDDISEADEVLRWMTVRMELNAENTGHPLHHRTSGAGGRMRVILANDPTLDATIRRWHEMPGSHPHARPVAEDSAHQERVFAEWDRQRAHYGERFAEVAPDALEEEVASGAISAEAAALEWRDTKAIVGVRAHDVLLRGAAIHAARREARRKHRGLDFRVMLCRETLATDRTITSLPDLAKSLEWYEWCMRAAEEAGIAGFGDEETTDDAYDAAIESMLTYELASSLYLQAVDYDGNAGEEHAQ